MKAHEPRGRVALGAVSIARLEAGADAQSDAKVECNRLLVAQKGINADAIDKLLRDFVGL